MARFSLIVKPTTDIDKVSDIIDSTGLKLSKEGGWKDKIIEPPAFVSMGDFNALSVEIIIAGKTQPSDQWSVIAEMRRRLLDDHADIVQAIDARHQRAAGFEAHIALT